MNFILNRNGERNQLRCWYKIKFDQTWLFFLVTPAQVSNVAHEFNVLINNMYHITLIHIYLCNSEQVALSCGTVINTYITKT